MNIFYIVLYTPARTPSAASNFPSANITINPGSKTGLLQPQNSASFREILIFLWMSNLIWVVVAVSHRYTFTLIDAERLWLHSLCLSPTVPEWWIEMPEGPLLTQRCLSGTGYRHGP